MKARVLALSAVVAWVGAIAFVLAGPWPEPNVSGTIRWVNSTTWAAIDDSGHAPEGIESVEVMADHLVVHFEESCIKVGSFQVTPDEAFASANVRVGASVGLDSASIYFYMPSYGSTPVPPSLLSKAGANVWLTGWCAP